MKSYKWWDWWDLNPQTPAMHAFKARSLPFKFTIP